MNSQNKRAVIWPVLILCCAVTLLAACSVNSSTNPTNDLQIALQPAPGGMAGATMGIQLIDAKGAPVTDARVALEGNMNHAGMAPVITEAVTDEADGTSDGIYQLPFQFTMLGDWIITVTVEQADGSTFTRNINATVGENDVTIDAPVAMGAMDHSEMDPDEMADHEMMESPVDHLMIDHVFARPVPLAGGNGAVYLTIMNGTDTDEQLLSVASDVAEAAELHETINDNNVMRMEPRPEGFAIPAGDELRLEPGGKHIMLVNLQQPLKEGDMLMLTLTFANADPMMLEVNVGADAADMDMNVDSATPSAGD